MKHGPSTMFASVAVLTVSDTRSLDDDCSGDVLVACLTAAGHTVVDRILVQDVQSLITQTIQAWTNDETIGVIIVTGGTGPSPRDVTPEAIQPMMASTMPGFGELFRMLSYLEIGAAAMLSRADAGWIDTACSRIPIFFLPGSPKAVQLAMDALIVPQLGHLLEVCSKEVKS